MTKICLFAGTVEGRRLAGFLSSQNVDLTVCVATEYGGSLIEPKPDLKLSCRRLSYEEMVRLFSEEHFDLVIDATHPFAAEVTRNIIHACGETDTEYQRVLRDPSSETGNLVVVPEVSSAAEFLDRSDGIILLTTGSKDLALFSGISGFAERVYVRVLPMPSSLEACEAAGVKPSHIIAMQGPFTEEMNTAMLRQIHASWLVTKDSGSGGGFEAKLSAAEKADAGVVVIGRPAQVEGLNESDMLKMLCSRYGFSRRPSVKIIGIGPGGRGTLTVNALQAINTADCLIGAKRMLETAGSTSAVSFEAVAPETITNLIKSHPELQNFSVLMSGDSGFYSGTRRLLPLLEDCAVEVLPGISSLSCLCSKRNISYEDIPTVSLHGRDQAFLSKICRHEKLFILTGGANTAGDICRKLVSAGLTEVKVTIGERLSYPEEKISCGSPAEFTDTDFDPLSVMLIENPAPQKIVTHGFPDQVFLRGNGEKGLIPMTKSEIRSVCLSKLALQADSVCWDIGSGTGSVAIEMAQQSVNGMVYAIEKDPEAVELSKKNAAAVCNTDNIVFVTGTASEVCADLPTPTHVFIGGSSGNLDEIFRMLFSRRSDMNITAAAVTLDSIAELNRILDSYPFSQTDVTMLQAAHGKKAGSHRLMLGENPVYLFTMRISGDNK